MVLHSVCHLPKFGNYSNSHLAGANKRNEMRNAAWNKPKRNLLLQDLHFVSVVVVVNVLVVEALDAMCMLKCVTLVSENNKQQNKK